MKAFPTPTFSINNEARVTAVGGEGGMDLRDYFAAKVMQAILPTYDIQDVFENENTQMPIIVAKDAYALADAMMKAREA
jgi:hypothetical protein